MNEQEYLEKIQGLEKKVQEQADQIAYLEGLSEIHNNVIMLANQERLEAEKIIHAHESIHGMSRISESTDVSGESHEYHQKEFTYSATLNSILEQGINTEKLLEAITASFDLHRGILFVKEQDKFLSKVFSHMHFDESKKPYFSFSLQVIRQLIQIKKSLHVKKQQVTTDIGEQILSVVCIPLLYHQELMGILYMDKLIPVAG